MNEEVERIDKEPYQVFFIVDRCRHGIRVSNGGHVDVGVNLIL